MTRALTVVYGLLAAANLTAVGFELSTLEWLTKPLLMPALAWLLLVRTVSAPRTRGLMLWGLAAATVADVALLIPGQDAMLVGIGFFAVMQVCFITAYSRVSSIPGRWRAMPWLPALYLIVWLGFIVTFWSDFADLAVPIAIYGLLLASMAASAGTVSPIVGLGGGLFMISDFMIGLGVAHIDFAGRSLAVMTTYCAAQFLIVWGMTRPSTAARSAQQL